MNSVVECRNCGNRRRIRRAASGQRVHCKNCGDAVRIPGKDRDPWEDDDDDDLTEDLPPRRKPAKKKGRRKKKKSGGKAGMIVGLSLCVLVVIGIVVGVVIWSGSRDSNSEGDEQAGKKNPDGRIGDPNRKFPSLTYAVTGLPSELADATRNAPFDVKEYFHAPSEDQNAASLYLDAFFEFSPDVKNCIAPKVAQERLAVATKREKQFRDVWPMSAKRPRITDPRRIDTLLTEFEPAFQKLAKAQERPACVFQPEVGALALMPHVFVARGVVIHLIHLRVRRHVVRGDLDAAIDDLKLGLRLTRDLRPRGSSFVQLASILMDKELCTEVLPRILSAKQLTVKQCDRLLQLIQEHIQNSRDIFLEAAKTQYLTQHMLAHNLQHRTGGMSTKRITEALQGEKFKPTPGRVLAYSSVLNGIDETGRDYDAAITRMSEGDFLRLRQSIDRAGNETWTALKLSDYFRIHGRLMSVNSRWTEGHRWRSAVHEPLDRLYQAATINKAHVLGALCLIAVRRSQLVNRGPVRDLAKACRDAGISQVPADPFTSPRHMQTMKLSTRSPGGGIAVYSVGPDYTNERGAVDWYTNHRDGDIIVPLTPPRW